MKTIQTTTISEQIIKNSRFITILIPIKEKEEIIPILSQIKLDYPKARHYCYAYRTETHQKASDDREPSKTAGIPMLNVLIKEDIINVLAITIRYFGGIKLGAGGLIRAYSQSVSEALTESTKIVLIPGFKINLTFPYDQQKQIDLFLSEKQILSKRFLEQITYQILIGEEKKKQLIYGTIEIIEKQLIPKQIEK